MRSSALVTDKMPNTKPAMTDREKAKPSNSTLQRSDRGSSSSFSSPQHKKKGRQHAPRLGDQNDLRRRTTWDVKGLVALIRVDDL
mmetsp:Transcript_15018/g.34202  ORF Transcript_15018/g.34202 Transcript_15018/m.34202 type:complete len:85 (+) Transcript_15018:672-926(+)